MTLDPAILHASAIALSVLWCGVGVQKLMNRSHHRAALADYDLLPPSLVALAALGLPILEIVLGVAFVVPALRLAAVAASLALLATYTLAIAINLARGRRDIDCGCGGPALRQSLSSGLVARNLCLMGFSLLVLARPMDRTLIWVDLLTIAGAVSAVSLLYVSANRMLAQSPILRAARH